MGKLIRRFVDMVADHAGADHVRVIWSAKTGESGSVRIMRHEAPHYIRALRSRFGRLSSLKVEPA